MHLNLPKRNESSFAYTWSYCKWSFLGVFGPELVLYTAWRQYLSAKALQDLSELPYKWSHKVSHAVTGPVFMLLMNYTRSE